MGPASLHASDGTPLSVDAEFLPLLKRHAWYPVPVEGGPSVYATKIGKAVVHLAHLVFGLVAPGPQRKIVLSFLDKDPRNCRLSNLSPMDVGLSRQRANVAKRGGIATSSYRGVVRDPRNGRFRASMGVEGRRVYLGSFDNEEEAARAYDVGVLEHYGERAALNFPHGPSK